ncbi:hypothetical protein N566_22785 [Streptomycetaceae bacterium MP113-05]|nr:hypothetical protein N566_22785 [Streptomycetaceae bacterium MP113-05]
MPKKTTEDDPADAALTQLTDAWSRLRPADDLERRVAEDAEYGPVHLVRLVSALDVGARQTGGTLANVTEQLTATEAGGGALHHLLELLHHGGALAAIAAARDLDAPTRGRVLAVLRPYWQAPMRSLARPLETAPPRRGRAHWRS